MPSDILPDSEYAHPFWQRVILEVGSGILPEIEPVSSLRPCVLA